MKKRLFALMIAGLMAVVMTGCGDDKAKEPAPDEAVQDQASDAQDQSEPEGDDTQAEAPAEKAGKFIIATDTTFSPFEFENEEGEFVGIDMDILKAVAEDQGFEYELSILGFDAAVTALEAGQADGVIAGMSITEDRQKKFDFSDPYFDSGVVMAVTTDSKITSYEELKGKNVALKTGTEGAKYAESIIEEYGFTASYFEDSASMYQDVIAGNSVACFEDYPVVGYAISQGLGLKMVGDKQAGNSYGFAVRKGENVELLEMFNKGLANLKENGKYQEVLDTYITE